MWQVLKHQDAPGSEMIKDKGGGIDQRIVPKEELLFHCRYWPLLQLFQDDVWALTM